MAVAQGTPPSPARRVQRWFQTSRPALVPLAIAIGAGAGAGAVLFRYLILWVTEFATGHADYSDAGRVADPSISALGPYFVLLVPVVGGLIYGPLIERFAKEARGHGVPEVMYAVRARGGRIRPAVAVVKSVASAVCIGTGGSVGREGPIVQIGSALGSTLGQRLHVAPNRMRLLVACGAAAGISATFNAPIAGVFFALELILGEFAADSFAMVVLASVTADLIGRAAFGDHAFLTLPAFHQAGGVEYLFYALLGVAAAVVGVAFIKVLYGCEDAFDRWWPGPRWLRPATGGLLLGLLLLALPEMYGVGYPILENSIDGKYGAGFLLLLLAGKLAAVSLTMAIGGSGGVFAPALFMGATLGTAFGTAVHATLPGLSGPPGAYGLIGMGAVFAATSRAPITAVLIIFELTGDYRIVLPLMVAVVISTVVSRALTSESIYTEKLARRGVDLWRMGLGPLTRVSVRSAMGPLPQPVPADTPFADLRARFARASLRDLPVADDGGHIYGVVHLRDVIDATDEDVGARTAGDVVTEVATVSVDDNLHDALTTLLTADGEGVMVRDADGNVAGWLTQRDVLRAYDPAVTSSATEGPPAPRR